MIIYNGFVKVKSGKIQHLSRFAKFVPVWLLIFMFVFSKKAELPENGVLKDTENKLSPSTGDQNAENFLFVDCTGFYE